MPSDLAKPSASYVRPSHFTSPTALVYKITIMSGATTGQWECQNRSQKEKPAHANGTQVEAMIDRQGQETPRTYHNIPSVVSSVGEGLVPDVDKKTTSISLPRIIADHGDFLNSQKRAVIQARNAYQEAKGLLLTVVAEWEMCRERFYKLRSEIEWCGEQIERHKKLFYADDGLTDSGELEYSIGQRLVLGIASDSGWSDRVSARIDLIKAELGRLTGRRKSFQKIVRIKKAALNEIEKRTQY